MAKQPGVSSPKFNSKPAIQLFFATDQIHGTYASITYATSDEPHIIFIIPQVIPSLIYLISHECLHALRLFGQPENKRLIDCIEPHHQERAKRALVPAIKKRFQHVIRAEEMATSYREGIVGQVVKCPMDLQIELNRVVKLGLSPEA